MKLLLSLVSGVAGYQASIDELIRSQRYINGQIIDSRDPGW